MFFTFLGLSIVGGTIVGLVWRYGEDWLERRNRRLVEEALQGGTEEQVVAQSTTNTQAN